MDSLAIQEKVIEELRTCFDPEIPVNIYELGLIYDVAVQPLGEVEIRMTLTSPHCPVAGSLPGEVEGKVRAVPGVKSPSSASVTPPRSSRPTSLSRSISSNCCEC